MSDFVIEQSPPEIDKGTAEQMQNDVRNLIKKARVSEYYFLIYLLGMALQELDNIEKGAPTPLTN